MQHMKKSGNNHDLGKRVRDLMREEACFVMRARRFGRLVTRAYDEALRDSAITGPQFTLLFSLAGAGPLQAAVLARELDIEKSTLSRTVARMIESGWLEERKEVNKPKMLALTPLGEEILEEALPHWRAAQARAIKAFEKDGSNALNHLIDKAHDI